MSSNTPGAPSLCRGFVKRAAGIASVMAFVPPIAVVPSTANAAADALNVTAQAYTQSPAAGCEF